MTKWVHDIIKWKKKDTAFLPDIFLKRVALFFFVLLSNSIVHKVPKHIQLNQERRFYM